MTRRIPITLILTITSILATTSEALARSSWS